MTLKEVKHKADCEQPLATIDVMNSIAHLFGYGPLRSTTVTVVPGHSNLFPREVECARATTSLSRKGRKEEAVRVACAGCVYSAKELSYYEGNQDLHIHRDYNRTMPPIVYIGRGLISDKAVTPLLERTSTSVKTTSDEGRPEQELRKSQEEPQEEQRRRQVQGHSSDRDLYCPRNDLTTIEWLCSPRKQKSSP